MQMPETEIDETKVATTEPGFPHLAQLMLEYGDYVLAANLFMLAAKYATVVADIERYMREANRAIMLSFDESPGPA